MEYLAHRVEETGKTQSLLEHLSAVATLAAQFAAAFGASDVAYRCGMLHDIGKYSDAFQRRIRGSSQHVDHSTAGMQVALSECKDIPVAFCIAGHHSGLPDLGTPHDAPEEGTFYAKKKRTVGNQLEDYSAYRSEISLADCPAQPTAAQASDVFFIRMLYSCLVDADFLDTENFMSSQTIQRGGYASNETLWEMLHQTLQAKGWLKGENGLNKLRSQILNEMLNKAQLPKNLFTLTVPTGGGKTVASMAFALKHGLTHGMSRVIYIIPYTSIIEQTQDVFEAIFGKENVIAHFANVDYSDDAQELEQKRRLAAENWDAPIVLTTAVQFFESLHGNRSSRCRKLHNIANSVLIFDEAQMLPQPYLKPCVHVMAKLVKEYGCSAVLCTATQPALSPLFETESISTAHELCPQPAAMYQAFRRVRYENIGTCPNEVLVQRLNAHEQVLCVVNSRKQASAIFEALQGEGCFHLSTRMYPAHRRAVLHQIRLRLKQGEACRVVSTSLIEAGVDVDFPCAYRELAGLDSIIQTGGRCNREGKRTMEQSVVYCFESEQKPPESMQKSIATTRRAMKKHEDIASPEAISDYFKFLLYGLKSDDELDAKQIVKDSTSGKHPFACIAERFKLIETTEYTVYIGVPEAQPLVDQLNRFGPSRALLRKLGQYAVSVYPNQYKELLGCGAATAVAENAAVLTDIGLYHEQTGLLFSVQTGQALIY